MERATIVTVLLLLAAFMCTLYVWMQYTIVDSKYLFVYNSSDLILNVSNPNGNSMYTVDKLGRITHRVNLDKRFGQNVSRTNIENGFILHGLERNVEFKVIEDSADFSLIKVLSTLKPYQNESHCVHLETGVLSWFGGPEISHQYWPVENLRLEDFSYVPKQQDNVVVAERYWLNSRGGFIYVDEKVPLFIDQNVNGNTLCLKAENKLPYNTRVTSFDLVYYLGSGKDAKEAQKEAVKRFLKKPTDVPDRRMVEHPIWSTWARYKRKINEETVELYASEIEKYGFNNSQLEIDDDWEECYGALKFRQSKFPHIKKQITDLKARGFRVTLWVHPFVNKFCDPWHSEAKAKGYFVKNHDGNWDVKWWTGNGRAGHIDFTNPDAVQWYTDRLKKLQEEMGIDSFKFDAGETSWIPADPKLNASLNDHPLAATKAYIRAVSQFGPMVEVRSGHGTQDLPIFLRFLDKDTEWGFNNGLATLITTLLQLNMVGYGFILPDMVGGNGYNHPPSQELFIRWLQASVFMPSIQYSYVPWNYDEKTIEICKEFTDLHAQYADEIMKAFEAAVASGEPVNPPIWWLDPNDNVALSINDEFLLGDRILAAPVIQQGAVTRKIYLPKGEWYDPNLKKTYLGPVWLMEYPAPIDVLPYFTRKN